MKIFVIDACALIAYLFDEEGSDFFQNMLIQARNSEIEMVMHFANLGEVYYDTLKRNDIPLLKTFLLCCSQPDIS